MKLIQIFLIIQRRKKILTVKEILRAKRFTLKKKSEMLKDSRYVKNH